MQLLVQGTVNFFNDPTIFFRAILSNGNVSTSLQDEESFFAAVALFLVNIFFSLFPELICTSDDKMSCRLVDR